MKRWLVVATSMCALGIGAQEVAPATAADTIEVKHNIIQEMAGHVTVHQSQEIEALMNGKLYAIPRNNGVKKKAISANPWGWRVEVFNSNDQRTGQQQANKIRAQLTGRVNGHNVYVRFDTPFWRVRVGDFRTREEAQAYLSVFRKNFPSLGSHAYVWRDHIRINVIADE